MSHNYPNYYPDDAYVLWTFQYEYGADNTDVIYDFSFGYIIIGYNDYLLMGTGWNPNDTAAVIVSYYGYYSGYPDELSIPVGKVFVEFDADSYSEGTGFNLNIKVLNMSGRIFQR